MTSGACTFEWQIDLQSARLGFERCAAYGHLIGWPALYLSGFARGPDLLRDMAYQAKPTAVVSRSALRSNGAFGAHVATVLAASAGCTGQLQTVTAAAMAAALLSAGKVAGSFSLGRTSCFKRSGCSVDCGGESVSTGDATRPRRWQCESWQTQGRCTTEQSTVAMRTALVTSVEREIIITCATSGQHGAINFVKTSTAKRATSFLV